MVNTKLMFSSKSAEYGTPAEMFGYWDSIYHFTLDPCATPANTKCAKFFTKEDDGLAQTWRGRVFMNPPYGREIGKWIKKAYDECVVLQHCELVVCLVPARTDTKWWHDYCMKAHEIRYLRGRIKFDGATKSAPFPSAIVIFMGKPT